VNSYLDGKEKIDSRLRGNDKWEKCVNPLGKYLLESLI